MAQVKKFNTGGSVQKMKYGNIIKNGTTYEMTEESMKRLEQYIAAADPDIQQSLANDWKLLMSGQDVTIDTMANRRSTVPEDFSKGQLKRLGKDKTTESKWHGAVNSDIHKYNLATQYLGKFDPSRSDKIEETPQKDFWKSNKSIEYDVDDEGNKKYRGLSNTDEKNYFNEITAYLMGDDAFRAQYKDPGISNFETLDSWFKTLPNPEEFVKNLWNKIENGQELNSDESQFWNAIQMKFENPKANSKYEEKVKSDETQAAKEKAWEAFNAGNVWNDSEMNSDYLVYNPTTGTFTVKTPTLDGKSIGYHFNDDFVANNYGYDHLKGKINFNGVWYDEEDLYNPESELYRMLTHKQYDYRNKNLRGDFDAANQVLKTNWSGVTYIPASSDYLGPFYGQNSPYIYQDTNLLTNNSKYGALDLGGKDWNLLKAINMNGSANDLGVRDWRYILTDAYGRYIDPYGNVIETPYEFDNNKFSNLYVGQTDPSKQTVNRYTRLTDDPTSPYYNTYADDIQYQADGKTPAFEGWLDIGENNAHMYINPIYGGIENTVFKNMPKNIYNHLYNKSFWENNYNNADQNTKYLFSELINGNKLSERQLGKINWESLGINDELKKVFIDYFLNNRQTMQRPEAFKEGGVIKYQNPSGPMMSKEIDDKVMQLSKRMSSPYESAVLSSKPELTNADKLELGSLITDAIGGLAGWIPVYGDAANFVLSSGVATGLGWAADRKRIKQGVMPKGTGLLNAATNVGADVLSLVPVVGDIANWGKFTMKLAGFAKHLVKSAGVLSLIGTAANNKEILSSIDKLIHGEDLTITDWRHFAQGLQLVSNGFRAIGRGVKDSNLAAKSGAKHPYNIKYKDASNKDVEIPLTDDEIKTLSNAKVKSNIDSTMDQILANHDVPENLRADIKAKGPSAFGFIHKYGRWMLPDVVKEAPSQKDAMYYMQHPGVRAEVLAEREAIDFARAVDNGASRTRAATHMKLNNQEAPEGYELTRKGKNLWHKSLEKKTKKSSSQQNNVSNQSSSAQSTSQQTPPKSTGYQNDPVYFKEGGILKGQDGLFELGTPYTEKLKRLYDIKLNPNGMITGSAPTGVKIDSPTKSTKTANTTPWGQNVSESSKSSIPTTVNELMSLARLGFDKKTNDLVTTQKAKGIQEAADASMLSPQVDSGQRMQLTAGDASKAAANRMFQHLPPVNADYSSYAAQQRAGFDAANTMLAQSDREYSAELNEKQDKRLTRQQMIADRNMQIEAHNRQIQAQKMAALSELYASKDAANRQSVANYMLEQQTKYGQNLEKVKEAQLAKDKLKWSSQAMQNYINDLNLDPDIAKAYKDSKSNLGIEYWVATQPQFKTKVTELTQKMHEWLADQQSKSILSNVPSWMYKSGGKMRSASDQIAINREKANDQIKVNKYKSFDKNWENQNKAVSKAIGKMHDRVYNILMKILS